MKVLGVIPARAGSKRLPGKNLKVLGGKPLVAWTIEAAFASGALDRVVVSTEDIKTAGVAMSFGAEWFERSRELATDTARVEDVAIEVLGRLGGKWDAVMLLQPTTPFRTPETIRRSVKLFSESDGESVVSVSPASSHPNLCRYVDEQGRLVKVLDQADIHRSQDLPPVYVLNGQIYLSTAKNLVETGSFYTAGTKALITEGSVDIDTEFDWFLAERIYEERAV